MDSENFEKDAAAHLIELGDTLQTTIQNTNEDRVQRITDLHNEIWRHGEEMLTKAFLVGELLVEQKQRMQHGQFAKWVADNLPFSVRTAQNYMRLFRRKEQIKSENVSLLSDAYSIMRLPRETLKESQDGEEKRYFITISVDKAHKELFEAALDIAKKMLNTESNTAAIMYIIYDWGMTAGS